VSALYGKLASEKIAEQNEFCRRAVKELNTYGLTQRQVMYLIYLLGLELEDVELMRAITDTVKEIGGSDLFLTPPPTG